MASDNENLPNLSAEEKQFLLKVARQTLVEYLATGKTISFNANSASLSQLRAVFVTLYNRKNNSLRGCRGETIAKMPIVEAVAKMSIASAVDDPRFPPVESAELKDLRIEINALTPMYKIDHSDIIIGKHGLMIVKNYRAGLLLPQVPVTYRWDKITYLNHLCIKADLPAGSWQGDDVELYAFESEEWGEE